MIAKNPQTAPIELPESLNDCSGQQTAPERSYPNILLVTGLQGDVGWVPEALRDGDRWMQCLVEVASTSHAALERLHAQPFDALMIRHTPPAADAWELLDALRLAGVDQPVVALLDQALPEHVNRGYACGVEAVLCLDGLTAQTLASVVKRAVDRFDLVRENQRLSHQERRMLSKDRDEAEHFIQQQRGMIRDLEAVATASKTALPTTRQANLQTQQVALVTERPTRESKVSSASLPRFELPDNLIAHYRELLRTFVIMGSGSLSGDISRLSQLLAETRTPPGAVMGLHLESVESLVGGLGRRSSRHVMSRAHLLALELMAHLATYYQQALAEPDREILKP